MRWTLGNYHLSHSLATNQKHREVKSLSKVTQHPRVRSQTQLDAKPLSSLLYQPCLEDLEHLAHAFTVQMGMLDPEKARDASKVTQQLPAEQQTQSILVER